MIRDIIVSYKLSNNHYRILSISRTNEDTTSDELGFKALTTLANDGENDFASYDEFLSVMRYMTQETYKRTVPALNYLGIYVDVLDRPDLSEDAVNALEQYPVRVYLIDPDQSAIAIASEDPSAASLPSAVMNLFITKMSVDPNIGAILKTQFEIDSFNALTPSGSEIEYDCTKFLNYVTANGRSIRIFVGGLE